MFIKRCVSAILAAGMLLQSWCVYALPAYQVVETDPAPIISDIVVDDTISEDSVEETMEETPDESDILVEEPVVEENTYGLTESEIDLIALVTMAEAEGESELGKRAVIDVILNRYDSTRFPNTINGVIYAKNAFECMINGRVDRCYVREDIRQLVLEELANRTYSNIHYFRASRYHSFGTPVVSIGNHYFSTY